MESTAEGLRALAHAKELFQAIEGAEEIIVSTIERECEALRGGRLLAAAALRTRLRDGSRIYLSAIRAARASVASLEDFLPGICDALDRQRMQFATLLKVELATLAMERAAADVDGLDFAVGDRGLRVVHGQASPARGYARSTSPARNFSIIDGAPEPQPPASGRKTG